MAVIVRGRALTPFRGYTEFAAQSWALILTLGLFFGWFLSFPLLGPILGRVTADRGTDPMALVLSFLAAHAMGLVAAGGLAYCDRRALTLFPLSLLPCIVLTFSVQGVPVATWPALFAIMGFFSAPVVIACADAFVASVPPSRRGHVLALGVALANLLVYLITLASRWAAAPSLVATAALLLTGAVLAIDHSRRQIAVAAQGPAVARPTLRELAPLLSQWPLLAFTSGAYVLGGFMYAVVFPASVEQEPFHVYYGVLPYIVLVLVAGAIADGHGRRIGAFLGAATVGVGFVLSELATGPSHHLIIYTFLIGGLAFLDVFIWTVLADMAVGARVSLYYGLGLGAKVLAILLGVMLGGAFVGLTTGEESTVTEVVELSILLTLALGPALRETLRRTQVRGPAGLHSSGGLMERVGAAGLTRRELEVAKLLIAGASNREMEERLVIAPDTLKTHLRSIYRKMGVRDRRGLTLVLVEELHRVIEGLESRLEQQAQG